MKKLLMILIATLLVACSSSTPSEKETLKIATSSGYPPYEMIDPTTESLIGFDIDLGNLIAQELDMEIEWLDMSFDGVIASLSTGTADMAIAALSPDPSRDALFTDAYYNSGESPFFVVTKKDSDIDSVNDLKGKVVGVQVGTIQEAAANNLKDELELTVDPRDAYNVMIQEIILNRIDFVIMEPLTANEYLQEFDQLKSFELVHPEIENIAGNAIAIAKSNPELLEKVNDVIQKLKDNKKIDELIKEWFE